MKGIRIMVSRFVPLDAAYGLGKPLEGETVGEWISRTGVAIVGVGAQEEIRQWVKERERDE